MTLWRDARLLQQELAALKGRRQALETRLAALQTTLEVLAELPPQQAAGAVAAMEERLCALQREQKEMAEDFSALWEEWEDTAWYLGIPTESAAPLAAP